MNTRGFFMASTVQSSAAAQGSTAAVATSANDHNVSAPCGPVDAAADAATASSSRLMAGMVPDGVPAARACAEDETYAAESVSDIPDGALTVGDLAKVFPELRPAELKALHKFSTFQAPYAFMGRGDPRGHDRKGRAHAYVLIEDAFEAVLHMHSLQQSLGFVDDGLTQLKARMWEKEQQQRQKQDETPIAPGAASSGGGSSSTAPLLDRRVRIRSLTVISAVAFQAANRTEHFGWLAPKWPTCICTPSCAPKHPMDRVDTPCTSPCTNHLTPLH